VSSGVAAVWREHGLSHAGGNALAVIEGAGRALTPGEIGAEMHITSGSITSLVDTLEKRGLVRRDSHEGDRRKVLVSITHDGVELLDRALPRIQLVVREQMAGLSDAERIQLLDLVRRAYDSVTAADPDHLDDVSPVRRNRPTRG
jgi:DNA-binding MarR family transcriptional regulator